MFHFSLTALFKFADFVIKLPQTGTLSPLYKGGFRCYHHGSISLKRLRRKKFNFNEVNYRWLIKEQQVTHRRVLHESCWP